MTLLAIIRLLLSSIFDALLTMPRLVLMGVVVAVMIGGMLILFAAASMFTYLSSRKQ